MYRPMVGGARSITLYDACTPSSEYIYTSCVVSCLSRPTGGDSFYEYWMFFGRELLQPVEIKIQTGEVNLERSPAL